MRFVKADWLSWSLCGAVAIATVAGISSELANGAGQDGWFAFAELLMFRVLPLKFAVVTALILARRPGNTVGWQRQWPASVGLLALVESAGADYDDLREGK